MNLHDIDLDKVLICLTISDNAPDTTSAKAFISYFCILLSTNYKQ